MAPFTKLATGSAVLLAATAFSGVAIASSGSSTPTTPTGTTPHGPGGGGPGGPGGGPGRGGPGGRDGAGPVNVTALATKLGVTADKLKAALKAVQSSQTKPARPDEAATIATALGVDESAVQKILDASRPSRPAQGTKPTTPTTPPTTPAAGTDPQAALVTALATGLGKDEASVKAALDTVHTAQQTAQKARQAAFVAALAAQLGLSSTTVQAALDATRPAAGSTQAGKRKHSSRHHSLRTR